MKQSILEILDKRAGQFLNVGQIAHHMGLASGQYKTLRHELKRLVADGKIIVDRSQRYSRRDENRVLRGTIKLHPDGYGFVAPEEKKRADVYVPRGKLNFAMNGDTVLVESARNQHDGRYEGRVIQVITRANKTLIGTLHENEGKHFVKFADARVGFEEIYIPRKNLKSAVANDFVAIDVVQFPGHGIAGIGEVRQVLGEKGDIAALRKAIVLRHGIPLEFPEAVRREAASLPDEVNDAVPARRQDLRDLPLITIDGPTAKDFDDAVCAVRRGKTTILYVCIADVAEYVRPGSPLDQEAYKRGTSTYFPDICIPMLPEALSNGLCSLKPFVPRLSLTAEIHFDENGKAKSARFYESVMRSQRRATYGEVEAYFDRTGTIDFPADVRKSLDIMHELAENMLRKTAGRGALSLDLPEAEVRYDPTGTVVGIGRRQRLFAHRLIEEFMIAANVAVAQYFSRRELPQLYRIHEPPDPIKLKEFIKSAAQLGFAKETKSFNTNKFFELIRGDVLESYLQTTFLRSLKQAIYSPDNRGHFGLALEDYAHFTSPIRRYPDLVVHRQLKSLLAKTPDGILVDAGVPARRHKTQQAQPVYTLDALHPIGNATSKREREAMEAEREVLELVRAQFFSGKLREKFFGTITRIIRNGFFVLLEPHFVEGFLPITEWRDEPLVFDDKRRCFVGRRTRQKFSPGHRLWVEVVDVSLETAQIRLAPSQKMGRQKKKP